MIYPLVVKRNINAIVAKIYPLLKGNVNLHQGMAFPTTNKFPHSTILYIKKPVIRYQ